MEIHERPFGEILKETRKKLGMTQQGLAEKLGVTPAHISNMEHGGLASESLRRLFFNTFKLETEVGNTEPTEKPFGEVMRETRKRLGMTQLELALQLGAGQSTIAGIECGAYNAGGTLKTLFYEKFSQTARQQAPQESEIAPHSIGAQILLQEIRAAREDLGQPMMNIEIKAWGQATEDELLKESVLLREILELRSTRELLAGAQAFRKRREAKGRCSSVC